MDMGFIQSIFSRVYGQELPFDAKDIFQSQKEFLSSLVEQYNLSPLYQNLGVKQEQLKSFDEKKLKEYLGHVSVVEYSSHIYPLVQDGLGITAFSPDLYIKTSGTSDAQAGGKLIPAQWSSLESEREAIQRTLAYYIDEHPHSKIFLPYSFALTAPFDEETNIGYVSWSLRRANRIIERTMFPSQKILRISDNATKREAILDELLDRITIPYIRSIHGVPAWPLAIIDMLIQKDKKQAQKILSKLEYVSIGWWAPSDYKQQFQKRLHKLWLQQQLSWSNNHNASEGFFGAQVREFSNLDFHWMVPLYKTNFFLFVPEDIYNQRKSENITTAQAIKKSRLLHEVRPQEVYFMLFANDRIPWLYDIKDKIHFKEQQDWDPLEYEVLGRHSMSSNLINEHLESDIIQKVLSVLAKQYDISTDHFVAWLELNDSKTSAEFHMILEWWSYTSSQLAMLTKEFDDLLGEYNTQWEFFRENDTRITACHIYLREYWFIREAMMQSWLGHEQSKIPFLSDHNYEAVVAPLLRIKKSSSR